MWNGGVKSTVDASVGFHIMLSDGVESDGTQQTNVDIMKRVLNLCQNHEDLHAKVVENTKHQLFDVIAMIEPLGYGSSLADNDDTYGDAIEVCTTVRCGNPAIAVIHAVQGTLSCVYAMVGLTLPMFRSIPRGTSLKVRMAKCLMKSIYRV